MLPKPGEEICVFAEDIARIAWLNGAYCAKMYCNGVSVDKLKLCYVKNNWAYFTTRAVEDQWGDDWNDAPYEYNAGEPYCFLPRDKHMEVAPWEIVKVAWSGAFDAPCDHHLNSPFSVEQINNKIVPWLYIQSWMRPVKGVPTSIFAGANLQEFRDFVHGNGGVVYEPTGAK